MVEIRVVEPRATAISLLIAGGWKLEAASWSWKLVLLAGSWLWFDTPLVAGGRGGLVGLRPFRRGSWEVGAE